MKRLFLTLILPAVVFTTCTSQVGGGSVYAQGQGTGSGNAEANERAKRAVSPSEAPPNATSMFLDASVLMNVKADEYVAIFGVSQEGATLAECRQKVDATIRQFSEELKQLGIGPNDVYVDFVVQNKIYGFDLVGDVAKEKVSGFELKKNVSIHYKDSSLLDRLLASASNTQIFDLIKVDYIVKDIGAVHTRLMQEAACAIGMRATNYERLLGIKVRPSAQVYAERNSAYYPTEMYDSYTAYESEDVTSNYYRQKFIVQGARKNRTFFFNALSPKTFDRVVNPVVIEPIVQFTLYLKVRYETGAGKQAEPTKPARSGAKRASHGSRRQRTKPAP